MIRNKLFRGFAILVVVFGVLSAVIGLGLIKNQVIKEAQIRVELDLGSAWSVQNSKLYEIETVLRLAASKQIIVDTCSAHDWANQEVHNRLEMIRVNFGLDFLSIVSTRGEVVIRSTPPYNKGDFKLSSTPLLKALQGKTVTSIELMSQNELEREQEGLSESAFMALENTPYSRPCQKTVETRGMVMMGSVPIEKGNQILGAIYGGVLLNRNYDVVDKIKNVVFKDEEYNGVPTGTATIFLNDCRISTTVRLANGNRALGTRASKEVADRVLDNGKRWVGRAFVVKDWYLTAYDPIRNSRNEIIGMLYVGLLEKPFKALIRSTILRYGILSISVLVVALILAFFLAGRISKPLHTLAVTAEKMQRGEKPEEIKSDNASKETERLIQAFNGMAEALTEREEKLKEANKKSEDANLSLKNINRSYMETLGFISHELKSPLATIMNYVYLIRERKFGDLTEKQKKGMKNIDNNVKLIVEMVRHYLNLSRIENGELEPIPSRVELMDEVLLPLLESYEEETSVRNITLQNNIEKDIILHTDLNMTREVFENLISNAIKYGREGGTIRLDAKNTENFVKFSVFNEGEGIPPEKIKNLFQKFSRLEDEKTHRRQKGTGLGLFITKNIIKSHGGEIKVQSKYHEWIDFQFTLPVYKKQKKI